VNHNISEYVKSKQDWMTYIRRQIHRHPELGYEEFQTAEIIRNTLKEIGLEPITGALPTSILAYLGHGRPVIALRADIDALTLKESNQVEYCSEIPGVMHGCGHDGHVAMLLGAAMTLVEMAESLPGTVLFIFQPAEESPKSGAQHLIDGGVLRNPPVDEIYALHLWPYLPFGILGVRSGPFLASSDGLVIEVIGKGGHAGKPHKAIDAIAVTSQIIVAFQTLMARHVDPVEPIVLHIGTIQGGTRRSIVASNVTLTGTIRALNEKVKENILSQAQQLAEQIASGFGAKLVWSIDPTQPVTVNDPFCTNRLSNASKSICKLDMPVLGADDFGRYLKHVPGAIGLLGCAQPGEEISLHSPNFNFDEEILSCGAEIFVRLVIDFFRNS